MPTLTLDVEVVTNVTENVGTVTEITRGMDMDTDGLTLDVNVQTTLEATVE